MKERNEALKDLIMNSIEELGQTSRPCLIEMVSHYASRLPSYKFWELAIAENNYHCIVYDKSGDVIVEEQDEDFEPAVARLLMKLHKSVQSEDPLREYLASGDNQGSNRHEPN
tara:strand:+ start:8909 stop:9247 length:339 start_codon:yes stop_codon:yes gene_type:complete